MKYALILLYMFCAPFASWSDDSGPNSNAVRAYRKICANNHILRKAWNQKTSDAPHAPIAPYCDAYDKYIENWWPRYLLRVEIEDNAK